jgi:hypothetical protein
VSDRQGRDRGNKKPGFKCSCWYCLPGSIKRVELRRRDERAQLAEYLDREGIPHNLNDKEN